MEPDVFDQRIKTLHDRLRMLQQQMNAAHHEREFAISVTDTGCGIAPADLSEIFAKGWCAAANGSIRGAGLGLFIVKTLVEAHTGRISVESTLGQGSCFTVFLPCESA